MKSDVVTNSVDAQLTLPLFETQTWNSSKVFRITSRQGLRVSQNYCGDHKIETADRLSPNRLRVQKLAVPPASLFGQDEYFESWCQPLNFLQFFRGIGGSISVEFAEAYTRSRNLGPFSDRTPCS